MEQERVSHLPEISWRGSSRQDEVVDALREGNQGSRNGVVRTRRTPAGISVAGKRIGCTRQDLGSGLEHFEAELSSNVGVEIGRDCRNASRLGQR